jgi:ankyrin repeat protein
MRLDFIDLDDNAFEYLAIECHESEFIRALEQSPEYISIEAKQKSLCDVVRCGGSPEMIIALLKFPLDRTVEVSFSCNDYMIGYIEEGNILHWCCNFGYTELLALLLEDKDMDLQVKADGELQPIHFAVEGGQIDVLGMLLDVDDGRVDVHAVTEEGWTILHRLASRGAAKALEMLLRDPRIDPLEFDQDGHQIIHLAAFSRSEQTIVSLLKNPQIDPVAVNRDGMQVLHIAATEEGCTSIVSVLLQDPRIDPAAWVLNHKMQAIHLAALNGHLETVEVLLKDARVDPPVVNEVGKRPIDYAIQNGHFDIAKLFQDRQNVKIPLRRSKRQGQ